MKKTLIGAAAAVALGLTGALAFVTAASAATGTPVESACNTGWYVNTDDEQERLPEQVEGGFKFEDADLVHHATDLKLKDLEPGSFDASPHPDQPSFFSVEVRDESTKAYGTLRWTGSTWTLTTNVDTFSHAEPADFIGTDTKWGKLTDAARVVSFGVGYTANPPGKVPTVVKSITFAGKTYTLSCPAKPANEHVTDEKWECATGYSTRGGTVEYTWDEAKHEWVKKAPVWGDWVKQRDLTDEESKTLECPTTPPAGDDNGSESPSPKPTTPTESAPVVTTSPSATQSPVAAGLPLTGDGSGINLPLVASLAGITMALAGAGILLALRRRRDNEVEFTA